MNKNKSDLYNDIVEVLVCCANCDYGNCWYPLGIPTRLKIGTDIRTIKCPECGKKKLCSRNTAPIIHKTQV